MSAADAAAAPAVTLINADLAVRAAVDGASLPWVASPSPMVERRMLERRGDELARATSLVRYAPGSRFPSHRHDGGEEFLVLDGVFCDQHGDFPAGTYVRNPVGSAHAPHTDQGCVIFVKLWWSHADDHAFVRIDTTDETRWTADDAQGVDQMALHAFGPETAALYRLAPGAALPARAVPGGEEIFVVSGACGDANGRYGALGWLRQPAGDAPALASPDGCTLLVKRGHLANPPAPPV